MEEEVRRERRRAECMARAAAWQLEKEEAEANKVSSMARYAICSEHTFATAHVLSCLPLAMPACGVVLERLKHSRIQTACTS